MFLEQCTQPKQKAPPLPTPCHQSSLDAISTWSSQLSNRMQQSRRTAGRQGAAGSFHWPGQWGGFGLAAGAIHRVGGCFERPPSSTQWLQPAELWLLSFLLKHSLLPALPPAPQGRVMDLQLACPQLCLQRNFSLCCCA